MAGTIAAVANNAGVVGVVPGVNLYIVRVFSDSCTWAYASSLIDALNRCTSRPGGVNIVTMSLGCTGVGCGSSAEESAFNQAYASGVLSVAAAGNDGTSNLSYPASYGSVISVAAIDSSGNVASFSQKNSQVELAAPGVSVLSTVPGGYASYSGTSMATPHVSGVAALVWSYFPTMTNVQIRNGLGASALDMGPAGRDTSYGYGIVQAKAAVDYLAASVGGGGPAPPGPSPTPAPAAQCAANGAPCNSNSNCCSALSCHPKRRRCRAV